MRISIPMVVNLDVALGQAQERGRRDPQAAPEADVGDALLAPGDTPAPGLLVELGPTELGQLLGLVHAQERGKVFESHLALLLGLAYTDGNCVTSWSLHPDGAMAAGRSAVSDLRQVSD